MHVEVYNKRKAAELGQALKDLNVYFEMKKITTFGNNGIKFNISTPVGNPELFQQIKQLVNASGGIKKS
jgi:hypothetical protein